MSVGLYDMDAATFKHVPFNLEIMKLSSYYKKQKEIVYLAPTLSPKRFTDFIIRKDYNDDNFPKEIYSEQNISYGGYAFSQDKYAPLDLEIEKQKPDISIYLKTRDNYLDTKFLASRFEVMKNAQHLRLSLDGKSVWKDFEKQFTIYPALRSLIFHDKNINDIEGAREVIQSLVERMSSGAVSRKIGFKFPIVVENEVDLLKWAAFNPLQSLYTLEINKTINDEVFSDFIIKQKDTYVAKQLWYNVVGNSKTEEEFVGEKIVQVFKQAVFCRQNRINILLRYTDDFFIDKRWERVIQLINIFLRQVFESDVKMVRPTLFTLVQGFIPSNEKQFYQELMPVFISQEEARELFHFVRENNYELFKLFYECESVSLKGGRLKSDWKRN